MKPNKALEICHKRELWALMRSLGEAWGEPRENLEVLAKEIYDAYKGNMEPALECFKDLLAQAKWICKKRKQV